MGLIPLFAVDANLPEGDAGRFQTGTVIVEVTDGKLTIVDLDRECKDKYTAMAKKIHLLSDREVRNLNKQGSFPDGNGLYLQVSDTGSKAWFYRYQVNHKGRKHGLGSYPTVTLKSARLRAEDCRTLRSEGIDPIEHKRQKDADKILEGAKTVTFKDCALLYIKSHKKGWKNRKHESQWSNTLETYAYPFIGDIAVQKIDVGLVMQVIEPIWHEKTETASRVRQRIEKVLDWAKVMQYRTGDNPAVWRGHIQNLLPKRSKVQKVQHFKAMPYVALPVERVAPMAPDLHPC